MKEYSDPNYPFRHHGAGRSAYTVLDTLLPSQANNILNQGIWDTGFEEFWKSFQQMMLPGVRLAFRAALFIGAWIAPLLIRHIPPLWRYDRTTREQALAALGESRFMLLRQSLTVLKAIASYCYGAHQDVREKIGYQQRSAIAQRGDFRES